MIYSPSASDCNPDRIATCFPPQIQVILLFFCLYLVAVGAGGHKPCLQAFGADQFDGQDPEELKAKSSFFNWWYFGLCFGIVFTHLILNYIQDNLNWTLGFGIPCIVMVMGLVIFLLGTKTYRYGIKGDEESPLLRIGRVFVCAARNWKTTTLALDYDEVTCGKLPQQSSEQFNFLDKALLARDGKQCSISEVEEAKTILRLVPIWATCLVYAILFAQTPTFFTKQGGTMVRSVVPGFDIPAASLQLFTSLTVVLFIPIYDRIIVPTARTLTGKPSGITMLQRIGIGIFLSATSMVSAAIVEMKRLKTAEEYGLLDTPNVTVPMSVWWLVPQYVLFGVSEAFTIAGLQEFFYNQVPIELGSVGISLYLSIFGIGSFLSSFLVSVIDKTTGGIGTQSWFIDNINRAHLDYLFWLLAVLSVIEMAAYFYFTKSYVSSRRSRI